MFSRNQRLGILILLFGAIFYHNINQNVVEPEIPVVTPVSEPVVSNGCDLLLTEAFNSKKYLLIVFGAEWCGYCKTLKRDLPEMIDTNKYVLCLTDIDDENNKELVNHFKIKTIPTSIIVEPNENKELKRITGYEKIKYKSWIK